MAREEYKDPHTRLYKIINDHIRQKSQVAWTEDKIRERCLRWFGHVLPQPKDALVHRYETMEKGVKRGWGGPKTP